jgi:hypothetical protein
MNDEKESQQQKVLAAMKDNKKEQTNKTKGFLQGHFFCSFNMAALRACLFEL